MSPSSASFCASVFIDESLRGVGGICWGNCSRTPTTSDSIFVEFRALSETNTLEAENGNENRLSQMAFLHSPHRDKLGCSGTVATFCARWHGVCCRNRSLPNPVLSCFSSACHSSRCSNPHALCWSKTKYRRSWAQLGQMKTCFSQARFFSHVSCCSTVSASTDNRDPKNERMEGARARASARPVKKGLLSRSETRTSASRTGTLSASEYALELRKRPVLREIPLSIARRQYQEHNMDK